jgi:hypothetical protein
MFVVNALMSDALCQRLRRQLNANGVLVCDLPQTEDDGPEQRRWLVGTFAVATVIVALRQAHAHILYVERVQIAAIDEEDDDDLPLLSRGEQIDRVGAERVCDTATYQGALLMAMAANEATLMTWTGELPNLRLDNFLELLGDLDGQWVAPPEEER